MTDPCAPAALPSYISILPPMRLGGAWGYACDACPTKWRNFDDEAAATEFAALHVKESHNGC